MKRMYTSAEARKTLQVDAKTFLRWLDQSDMHPQVSKSDHRIKLFTRQQIEKLAEEHERALLTVDLPEQGSLEARIEALERRMDELESIARARGAQDTLPARARGAQDKIPRARASDTLPGDLVSCPQFARAHNIAVSTVQKAIETGRLQIIRGEWKVGKAIVQKALDSEGRAQFYLLYSANEHFISCENCPHK